VQDTHPSIRPSRIHIIPRWYLGNISSEYHGDPDQLGQRDWKFMSESRRRYATLVSWHSGSSPNLRSKCIALCNGRYCVGASYSVHSAETSNIPRPSLTSLSQLSWWALQFPMGVVQGFHLAFREALKRLGHTGPPASFTGQRSNESPSKLHMKHVAAR